jgi:hypothetical protein
MVEAIQYPWIALCLREVVRRTVEHDYVIHVWDNAGLREHRAVMAETPGVRIWPDPPRTQPIPHAQALDELVARTDDDVEYLVTLDTDAAPVADDWLSTMTAHLDDGASLVGIWRDEMASELSPFVHPSCLCIRRQELLDLGVRFSVHHRMEPGQDLTEAAVARHQQIVPLRRSNTLSPHFLIAGIYGDVVYHHGAGSRPAWFYASEDQVEDERIRVLIREAAFDDFDHLVAVLRGEQDNDIW